MHQTLSGCGPQCASYLEGDVQRLRRFQASFALHTSLDGLAVNELHDVEIVVLIGAEIEDRGNLRMPERRCGPGLPQKSLSRSVTLEVGEINYLLGGRAAQIAIESLVLIPPLSSTHLPQPPVPPTPPL